MDTCVPPMKMDDSTVPFPCIPPKVQGDHMEMALVGERLAPQGLFKGRLVQRQAVLVPFQLNPPTFFLPQINTDEEFGVTDGHRWEMNTDG